MKINTNRKSGFTLVEIMIVVAIIGLLAAIAIPNFVRARATSQKNACINNLRQIDGAVQQYMLENKLTPPQAAIPDTEVALYLKQGVRTACPADGLNGTLSTSYTFGDGSDTAAGIPACINHAAAPESHVLP